MRGLLYEEKLRGVDSLLPLFSENSFLVQKIENKKSMLIATKWDEYIISAETSLNTKYKIHRTNKLKKILPVIFKKAYLIILDIALNLDEFK